MTGLTQARLMELLSYNAETGVFVWRVGRRCQVRAGDVAGVSNKGYRVIHIDRRNYLAHRLAWLYVHGEWPRQQIDHRNGERGDNRIANLREATPTQNAGNAKARVTYKGVTWHKRGRKWMAQITINGCPIYLGLFTDQAAAHAAYAHAARKHFGEFARLS